MTDNTTTPTVAERLRRLSQIARRHLKLLVAVSVIAAAAAVMMGARSSKQYVATSKLVLDESQLVGVSSSTPLVPNPDPERDINTKVSLVVAGPVANAVLSQLRLAMPLKSLLSKVQVATDGTSNIVDITVTDPSAVRAAEIANSFAQQYVTYRRTVARSSFQAAADAVRRQLSQLGTGSGAAAQAAALKGQLRQITIASASQTGGAIVLNQAHAAPGTTQSLAALGLIGGLVGLLLATTVVCLLELTDRRLKDGEDIASAFRVRVVAEIPRASISLPGLSRFAHKRSQSEAYDKLAGQLVLAGRRRRVTTVMITSPSVGDGKTTVTLGLANALARLDRRVLVVETPARTSLVPDAASLGLSGIVAGQSTLCDEVVRLPASLVERSATGLDVQADGRISILPVGSEEIPSHRLLTRPEVATVINEGREIADFVLIDGPSAERLHDALSVVDAVDAGLMVSRLRWTVGDGLHNALEALEVLGVRLLGLVLTNASGGSSSAIRANGNLAVIPFEASTNGAGAEVSRATTWRAWHSSSERHTTP